MTQVLVFGSGDISRIIKNYFLQEAPSWHCQLTIIDIPPSDEAARRELIRNADLVISLDPDYHHRIAEDCIECGTHLLTPARINEKIMNLRSRLEKKNLLFLYEIGFDPGLDHMNALHCIQEIHAQGGKIHSFHSHSARLAAEQNENPWHFKTGEPIQLIREGKDGAVYKERGQLIHLKYQEMFDRSRLVEFPGLGFLGWYPVADSLGYIQLYGLDNAATVVRTTLRHPDFIYGWKNIVELQLTDATPDYETEGQSLADFFKAYFEKNGFAGWLEKKMMDRFSQTKDILEKLMQFMEVEQEAMEASAENAGNVLMVDEKGKLGNIDLAEVKDKAAAIVAYKMHEANLTLKQLFFLGMDDQDTIINKGKSSPADILTMALERNLSFIKGEHDLAAMMQEIEYELNGQQIVLSSSLLIKGNDEHSAIDNITGLMLGITAKLVLTDQLALKGLHIPINRALYEPVLNELSQHGIVFDVQIRQP